ncbi:hypothetical protein AVEN_247541-1 [Araneus ventricosus]|uniref:Uncharacterized protein n=1 Tax=Araneus ventricosus TaxID=182803 RepID=A0A4Y2VDW6_ARAVE|nr:hypothetical protein AVEN_247541-1 [Araneus ventricosus]
MTMSLNACVKRKHPPDFGSFDKVPPDERMANYPVVSPSKRADHMCGENRSPPWDSEICHMPLSRTHVTAYVTAHVKSLKNGRKN